VATVGLQVEDGADIRMPDVAREPRLARETGEGPRARRLLRVQNFDRDGSREPVIPRAVHRAIAAAPERLAELVARAEHVALEDGGCSARAHGRRIRGRPVPIVRNGKRGVYPHIRPYGVLAVWVGQTARPRRAVI
jgi:hypothetical protein